MNEHITPREFDQLISMVRDGFKGVNDRLDRVNGRLDKHDDKIVSNNDRIDAIDKQVAVLEAADRKAFRAGIAALLTALAAAIWTLLGK